jgi:hypothetical protein
MAALRIAVAIVLLLASADLCAFTHYSVMHEGQRVGEVIITSRPDPRGTREVETLVLDVEQGLGHRNVTREVEVLRNAVGDLLEMAFRFDGALSPIHWRGQVLDRQLRTSSQKNGKDKPVLVDLRGEPFLVAHRTEPLRDLWQDTTSHLLHSLFDPAQLATLDVQSTATKRGDGSFEIREILGPSHRTHEETLIVDAQGQLQELHTQMFGEDVNIALCADACAPIDATLDPLEHRVVRSPVSIPDTLVHRTLRYVLDGDIDASFQIPTTAEQNVQRDGGSTVITICSHCGNEPAPTAAALQHYLAPNVWVRSDAIEIQHFAQQAGRSTQRVDLHMRALVERVNRRMRGTISFLGYADALEALRTGAGDCTEHAVLLAALARAQKIPTRVVSGLVYASRFSGKKNVFSPHMWVQAWDGERWLSYDSALNGFDSTHIALAIGDGSPEQYEAAVRELKNLRMEKAGVVRDPP